MDDLSPDILQKFDTLIELTAEDGFKESVKAKNAFGSYRSLNMGDDGGGAVLFDHGRTVLLARRIVRPLSAAAVVANRIARGEFETDIPQDSTNETGALLESMTVMQTSIREMMGARRRRSGTRRKVA